MNYRFPLSTIASQKSLDHPSSSVHEIEAPPKIERIDVKNAAGKIRLEDAHICVKMMSTNGLVRDIYLDDHGLVIHKYHSPSTEPKIFEHPNIVRMSRLEFAGAYATDYAENGNIYDHVITQKGITENLLQETAKACLNAINFLHQNQVSHKNLRAASVLVFGQDSEIEIKVTNPVEQFNLRKRLYGQKEDIQFVAPELFDSHYVPASDIWSIGILLFILVSGQPPFKAFKGKK